MSELFDLPESKSPRLQWIEKHGIGLMPVGNKWAAWSSEKRTKTAHTVACYDTQDEAITHLAKKMNLRLWNEEEKP